MFNIYDIENGLLKRIIADATPVSALWDEKYNSMGTFTLELGVLPQYLTKINADSVDSFISWQEAQTLMIIKSVEKNSRVITITGNSASKLLDERVVLGQFAGGNVETRLTGLVDSLDYNYLTNGTISGYNETTQTQVGNTTHYTVAEELTQAVDMGFEVYKDKKEVKFRCYKPVENPNFKLSSNIGNLSDEIVVQSCANYYDSIVILGKGFVLRAGNQESNRRELFLDQSYETAEEGETDAQFKQRILNFGLMQLGRYNLIEQYKVSVKVTPNADKARLLRAQPTLGDIVSISMLSFGVQVKARIIGLQTKLQNNELTQIAEIGTPILIRR